MPHPSHPTDPSPAAAGSSRLSVALGGLLVLLPALALYFGLGPMEAHQATGLAVLCVFGVLSLIAAMALLAMLFRGLGLANRQEAFGLPAGTIRATIALSLIVLFAIVAMKQLHHQDTSPAELQATHLQALPEAELMALIKDPRNRVLTAQPHGCAASQTCYDVRLVQMPSSEGQDLAKQLLVLIGTLMTSVTSYYFAARTAAGRADAPTAERPAAADAQPAQSKALSLAAGPGSADLEEACCVPVDAPTRDEDLPAATGGVA